MPDIEDVEFIDCSTISIQYDATGRATISFVIVKNDLRVLSKSYSSLSFGGISFYECLVMSAIQRPIIGSGGWCEWQMQLQSW